jgi:glycosyltransferase involved in cell wall biosynthesis
MGVKIRDQLNFQKSTVREIDWANFIALSASEREMLFEYTPVVINSKRALVYYSQIPRTHHTIVVTWNQSDLYFKLANYLAKINNSFQTCEPVLSKDLGLLLPIKNHSLHLEITNCDHKIVFPEIKTQPRLVFIGRLNYQKGLDIFLKLARGNQELEFIVIGSGPLEDFVEWQCFRQKNLTFLGKKENPLCFLRNTDIVILPSRYFEGLNLVLLEAIRHRVRVLSSGVGLMSKVHSDFHTFSYEKKMARDSYRWFQKKLEEIKP